MSAWGYDNHDAHRESREHATHLFAPVLQILDQTLFANLKFGMLRLHLFPDALGVLGRGGKRLGLGCAVRREGQSALSCMIYGARDMVSVAARRDRYGEDEEEKSMKGQKGPNGKRTR